MNQKIISVFGACIAGIIFQRLRTKLVIIASLSGFLIGLTFLLWCPNIYVLSINITLQLVYLGNLLTTYRLRGRALPAAGDDGRRRCWLRRRGRRRSCSSSATATSARRASSRCSATWSRASRRSAAERSRHARVVGRSGAWL